VLYEQGKVILSKKARNKHEELIQKLAVKKDGFIETYLVNETAENVWFDQFRIMSTGPLIVQETHYDPWGVELSGLGYQYGGIKVNPYLYNGKEANGHLGVNMFDYGARMYDPAIGRWFVVDPLANHELQLDKSPYAYGWNNPIKYIDPNGLCPNGCSENEKSGEPYKDGAIVQNKYGTSQYVDGEWVTISSTPDGSGENTSTVESGGGGNGSGASSEGNGFFGSTGWGDMTSNINTGIGAFGISNGAKTELFDYAVRNNYKSAQSWSKFNKLRPAQQAWRANNTLGKTGISYLKYAKGLGVISAGVSTTYSISNAGMYYYNGGSDWQVGVKSSLDVIMTGASFFGPVGFGISASYFILDVSTGGFGGFGSTKK
ncbi:MAG: RHS repeat-associated core domain-containing protein, partial [Algoriphagus sp.]|uniref:RHS repeat domain-containing protein n=1 Tax=Algoriphagus sp. TaxID=1872435 RepID=UPI002735D9A1